VKRRGEAEHDPGQDRHERGERHHSPVDANRTEKREVDRKNLDQQRDTAVRDGHAKQPTQRREDDALGKELTGETPPASA
jgi:hypothetical protein